MRAVVYDAYRGTPVRTEVPEPTCPPDGVLVRVGATGVCRSDWHAWMGHDPVPLPMVPGHEYAGTVDAVGTEVTRWQIGDRVIVPFACGCGQCKQCATGDTHVCPNQTQPGFTGWGSFADLVAVHAADTNLVALPESLGFLEAAALGCRVATAYRAVVASARVAPGEWLAVHGCGGVGLSAVMIATALGALVVAVDVSPFALAAARDLGAVPLDATGLNPERVANAVHDISGAGAHASIDALGSVTTMTGSVLSLRPRGRHVQVGLLLSEHAAPPVPMGRLVSLELELIGAHGMPARDYPALLELVTSGRLPLDRLVGPVIALDGAPAALMAMSSPATHAGITVIDLTR